MPFNILLTFSVRRPLCSTASEYRLGFLGRLSELPCVLAQCDKSDCFSQTNNNKYLTISPYVRAFMALLNGPNDVVTPQVRMKTYLTLVFVLAHHDGVDNAENILQLIFRGLADMDRSVRLSAG
jgi:serine/threonine-protein kinase ATR